MHSRNYNHIFSDKPASSPLQVYALVGFTLSVGALCFAYYLEYQKGVLPCPLCILQRGVFMLLAAFFLLQAMTRNSAPWLSRTLSTITALTSLMGAGLAGRQVWMEHLPTEEVPQCTASIDRLMDMYPMMEVFRKILTTSGECAEVAMRIVGLSLAEWSFVLFQVLFLICLYQWKNADL